MIDLIINNNTPLDLGKDARLRIEKARGTEGTIEAEKTFASDLPASSNNLKNLGVLNEVSAKKNLSRLPATLRKDGQTIIEGLLNIKGADEKKINYQIDSNYSAFKQKIKGKKLRDILEGLTNTFPVETSAYKYFITSLPAIIFDPAYDLLIDSVVVASTPVNFKTELVIEELAAQANLSPNAIGFNFHVRDGFLVTLPIIDNSPALIQLRYTDLSSNVILIDASFVFESLCLINNYDFTDFVFPRMSNTKFYTDKVVFSGKINEWDGVNNRLKNNRMRLLKNDYSIIPMFRIKYILDKIFEFAGASWAGFFDEAEQDLILYNNFELAKSGRFLDNLEPLPFNAYSELMEYKNHVPNIEIESFLLTLAFTFNLEIDIQGTQFTFVRRAAQIAATPQNIAAGYKIVKSTFQAKRDFTLSYQDNPDDFFEDYTQITAGASDTELINLPFSTLRYDASFAAIDDLEGSTQLFSQYFQTLPTDPILWLEPAVFNECPLRLLYYKGLQSGQPTATAQPVAGYANNLLLNDAAGLSQYWADWFTFLNETETVNLLLWLTAAQISAFNIYGTIQIDHLRFYPLKLGADLENKNIQRAATVEAYLIP